MFTLCFARCHSVLLDWGAQAASLQFAAACHEHEWYPDETDQQCIRQAAECYRLAACAPQNRNT